MNCISKNVRAALPAFLTALLFAPPVPDGVVFIYEPCDFDDAREVVTTFRQT